MGVLTKEQTTIERLLPEIRATHAAFLKSGKETVDLAKQVGDRLWTLKECVKQGEWTKMVEERCEFSIRTAQTYMTLAGGWEYLEKKEAVTTTIDGCVKLIGQAKPKRGENGNRKPKPPNAGGGSNPPDTAQISDKGKPGGLVSTPTPYPASSGPASGEAADSNLGKCPNCGGKKWTEDEFGVTCAKCNHPHGEPVGDQDEGRAGTQRSKTVKTVEALMRAFDDLNRILPRPEHVEAIASCKFLLKTARAWK